MRDGGLVYGIGYSYTGWCVNKEDWVFVDGWGVSIRFVVLEYVMGYYYTGSGASILDGLLVHRMRC